MENQKKASPKKALKIADKGIELVLAIVLIFFIVVGVLIFLLNRSGNLNNNSELTDSTTQLMNQGPSQSLEVEDSKKISVSGVSITLGEGWSVISISKDYTKDLQYNCSEVDQVSCIAYTVTNNNQKYYISSPAALRTKVDVPTVNEEDNINISSKDYTFNFEKVMVYFEDDNGDLKEDPNVVIYKEVYGCISSDLCVSSGLLNIEDATINKAEVENFKSFLSSLTIS